MRTDRIAATVVVAGLAAAAHAQATAPRAVQIRSVDFNAGILEVFNFGDAPVDLEGWRFCSHDFDQARRYTSPGGLAGVTMWSLCGRTSVAKSLRTALRCCGTP